MRALGVDDAFADAWTSPVGGRWTKYRTPWVASAGSTWLTTTVGEGMFRNTGAGGGNGDTLYVEGGRPDGIVYAETGELTVDSTRMGVAFRVVDDSNYWTFFAYRAGGGTRGYFLRSIVAGAVSFDSGFTTTGGRTGTIPLEVRFNGGLIEAYYDNVLRVSTTSSTHLAGTKHGVNADTGSAYRRWFHMPSFNAGDRPWPPYWNL